MQGENTGNVVCFSGFAEIWCRENQLQFFLFYFIDKTLSFRVIYFDILKAEECVKRQDGIKSYKQVSNTIAILMVYFTRTDLVSVIVLRRVLKRHQSV